MIGGLHKRKKVSRFEISKGLHVWASVPKASDENII